MMLVSVIALCQCVHLCVLDEEKTLLGVGSDPDLCVHLDDSGGHHCNSSVFHTRNCCY